MNDHFILIGHIPKVPLDHSQEYLKILKTMISSCSNRFKSTLLSPYSITIDHEFLGIPASLKSSLESIFFLEEITLEWNIYFKISSVIHFGSISSRLNQKTSSQLMGEGISTAREIINKKKISHPRIFFHIKPEKLSLQLNRLFRVLDSITSEWNQRDFPLISDMLKNDHNEEIAIKHKKNRSQIWKRRNTLKISEYKDLKQVILEML
jgi:hypothetical protein